MTSPARAPIGRDPASLPDHQGPFRSLQWRHRTWTGQLSSPLVDARRQLRTRSSNNSNNSNNSNSNNSNNPDCCRCLEWRRCHGDPSRPTVTPTTVYHGISISDAYFASQLTSRPRLNYAALSLRSRWFFFVHQHPPTLWVFFFVFGLS